MHCCTTMRETSQDKKFSFKYISRYREYGFQLYYKGAMYLTFYCFWCGKRLPESVRDQFFEVLEKEFNMEDFGAFDDDALLPEEMKTDEWWRKRCK